MIYDRQKFDSEVIILGLGYATGLLTLIGWIATLVL